MRIFQLCGDAGVQPRALRGSAVHLRAVASGLVNRGHEVISFMSGSLAGPEKFPAELKVLSSSSELLEVADEVGAPDIIYERYTLGHGVSLVPGHHDDSGQCTPWAGLEAAEKIACPFVLEVNSPMVLEAAHHRGLKATAGHFACEKELMSRADAVVAVSEPMRRYVASIRGSDRMTMTAHNGFHPELFPLPAPLDQSPPVIVFCGNPRPWHGLEYLPSLLARLRTRGLRPVARIIGGPVMAEDAQGRRELARLEELARQMGVESQLDLVGGVTQADAALLLSAATVAVAPYRPDPFFYFSPIKLFEYMGAGLPVVSTAQGDVPEIVGAGGKIVAPGDLDGFTDALEEILRNRDAALDLGDQARKRAFGNFTWGHTVDKLEMQFRQLLQMQGI